MASFARRTDFVPFGVEMSEGDELEKEFLIGGLDRGTALTSPSGGRRRHSPSSSSAPSSPPSGLASLQVGNAALLVSSVAVIVVASTESISLHGHMDSLLVVALVLGSVACAAGVLGLLGARTCSRSLVVVGVNHALALVCVLLAVLVGVGAFLRWDARGTPTDTLELGRAVPIAHRHWVWATALAAALSSMSVARAALRVEWPDSDDVFRFTVYACCAVELAMGVGVVLSGYVVWRHGELRTAANPWSILGSVAAGAALCAVSVLGVTIQSQQRLAVVLFWLPIVAVFLLFFSIVNFLSSHEDDVVDRRRYMLVSGLVGMWGQAVLGVGISTVQLWRQKFKFS